MIWLQKVCGGRVFIRKYLWDIWQSINVDCAVTSESDKVMEAENKRQLWKSRANKTQLEVFQQTLLVLNVTDCFMHELES